MYAMIAYIKSEDKKGKERKKRRGKWLFFLRKILIILFLILNPTRRKKHKKFFHNQCATLLSYFKKNSEPFILAKKPWAGFEPAISTLPRWRIATMLPGRSAVNQ